AVVATLQRVRQLALVGKDAISYGEAVSAILIGEQGVEREVLVSERSVETTSPIRIHLTQMNIGICGQRRQSCGGIDNDLTGNIHVITVIVDVEGTCRGALQSKAVELVHLFAKVGVYEKSSANGCTHIRLQRLLRIPAFLQTDKRRVVRCPVHIDVP